VLDTFTDQRSQADDARANGRRAVAVLFFIPGPAAQRPRESLSSLASVSSFARLTRAATYPARRHWTGSRGRDETDSTVTSGQFWRDTEARFALIKGEIEGIWSVEAGTGLITWNLHHTSDLSDEQGDGPPKTAALFARCEGHRTGDVRLCAYEGAATAFVGDWSRASS
jgi:hypothetical protein